MPYPKLIVLVSFCWKMNILPSKIKTNSFYWTMSLKLTIKFAAFFVFHPVYKRQCTEKTLTFRKSMFMRASLENFRIFTFNTAISFNILLVLQIYCRYKMTCLSAYMYRQISKCTDKTPKKHLSPPPPPSGYASATYTSITKKLHNLNS